MEQDTVSKTQNPNPKSKQKLLRIFSGKFASGKKKILHMEADGKHRVRVIGQVVVVHTFSPSTKKQISVNSRPAWSTK